MPASPIQLGGAPPTALLVLGTTICTQLCWAGHIHVQLVPARNSLPDLEGAFPRPAGHRGWTSPSGSGQFSVAIMASPPMVTSQMFALGVL